MSINRVVRYLAGLLIASILLGIGLPLAGIERSKFLPPNIIYANAAGKAHGVVISKEVAPTANPFSVGDHVWLVMYAFRAPPPLARGQTKPGPTQRYYGTARVDEQTFNSAATDVPIPQIKYEITDPDINGIDAPYAQIFSGGRSVGAGSNILSGWLLFVLLDLVLAYGIMTFILERFGTKENI